MKFVPKGAVVHAMGGLIDYKGDLVRGDKYLDILGPNGGANGFIEQDGTYIDGMPKGFNTPHAGKSYHKQKNIIGLNSHYVGYELFVDNAKNLEELYYQMENNPLIYSQEQYLTLARILYNDMVNFGFDTSFIVGHDEVAGDDVRGKGEGKRDPGPFFDWDKLFGYIELEKLKNG